MIAEIVEDSSGDKYFTKDEFRKILKENKDNDQLHDSIAEFSSRGDALVIHGLGHFQFLVDDGGSTHADFFNTKEEMVEEDLTIYAVIELIESNLNTKKKVKKISP